MSFITAYELRKLVNYDPETGIFTARVKRKCVSVGSVLGRKNKILGYVQVGILRERYYAHRLAWLWMTGDWPQHEIDHIDLDRSNNRWSNLREATSSNNKVNKGVRKDSQSGIKGIHQIPSGSYRVRIKHNGAIHHDKCYRDLQEAKAAFYEVSFRLHGEFVRTY